MFRSLYRDPKIIIPAILAIIIKLFSLRPDWVEAYYTYGIYPLISGFLRILFGWVPFSIGDLLYFFAFILLLRLVWKLIRGLRSRERRKTLFRVIVNRLIRLLLFIYVLFNLLWGLNYDREGIAAQLDLKVERYSTDDLKRLTAILQQKLNACAAQVDSAERQRLDNNHILFERGIAAYAQTKDGFPFLKYAHPSVKPSLYSHIGHYFGFTGYYNPFSGEAQLKTTVPMFMKPFIITHEIGHQLGYGKENEANFVGYLACKNSRDIDFQYSAYFEMILYALGDLHRKDSVAANQFRMAWHPRVKNDYNAYVQYLINTQNPVEPVIMRFYDQFLKMNNQPHGKETYNEVVAWLVAYMKEPGTPGP